MSTRVRTEVSLHESKVLAGNPLGDPVTRELGVILPPSYDGSSRRYPVILMLQGYSGTGMQFLNRGGWGVPLDRRLETLYAAGTAAEAIVILPDCFTRYGGSQYVDSPAIGRYQTFMTEEIWPEIDRRYRTIPKREGRAVIGKSSGGYGALELAMRRPDLVSAVASHAGDCAFELSYFLEIGKVVMALEKKGGIAAWLEWFDEQPMKSGHATMVMSNVCCAAAWSPRATGPYGYGEGFDLPVDLKTCALRQDVWARWLARDPVRMLDDARCVDALRSMRSIFIDAGKDDEFNLQFGARQMAAKLSAAAVPFLHEEFDGGHMNTLFRYDRSLELISKSLASS